MLFWMGVVSVTATKELVIRKVEDAKYESNISSICVCDAKGIHAIGFEIGELELRNEQNGNILREIPEAHEGTVASVALNANIQTLVSGSWDETVRLWDVESASPI